MATHSPLDFIADWAMKDAGAAVRGSAALWPLTGWRFPLSEHLGLVEHLGTELQPVLLIAEAVGVLLLFRAWLAARRGASASGR
jgi:hypothetical protein